MEHLTVDVLPFVRLAVVVAFVLPALVAIVRAPRSGASGGWVAAAFSAIALGLLVGFVPDALDVRVPAWVASVQLMLILIFPYLLLRFTASFSKLPVWLEVAAATATACVVLATLLLPVQSVGDGPVPSWAGLYIAGVLGYWVLVSLVTVVRLWRAGTAQPTVVRRRMRLMSAGTAILAITLLLIAQLGEDSMTLQLLVQVTVLTSALIFGLGFSPPRAVRLSWRLAEEEQLQLAVMAVLRASSVEEVAQELLPPTVSIVGGSGGALVNPEGYVLAAHKQAPEPGTYLGDAAAGKRPARQDVALDAGRGKFVVWTSPYTPFFGRDELDRLRTMGAVASLAIERCELLAEERDRRSVLEQAQQEAEKARAEASRANLAKTEFLSRMSHELRTPLNAVLGFGQVLEIALEDAENQEAVRHILKAGRHLLALIKDVIDLSRVESGTLAISLEPVHAGELIDDTVDLIRPLAKTRSITLLTPSTGCDTYVMTDRQRCRQVLLNLLSNAVKYNHDGGEVVVSCVPGSGESLRLSVRDTGPGIDGTRLERLFEPFDRLGAETSGIEGTGLGLALTKQLVERLGGEIGVETSSGEGATFWIDLPVTQPPADADADEPLRDSPPPAGADRTLLLVEDNLANLRLVEVMLRQRPGIGVLPAMQGRLAVDLAIQHEPDVILLDLHLPDLSGREVLHRLRSHPRTRDIPVVIASADATPGRVRQLQEEGAFDYLTKPLELQRFLDTVDAALAHRETLRDRPGA